MSIKQQQKNRGVILMSVLLMMNVITFLVLIGLQSSELEMRMSQNYIKNMRSRVAAHLILKNLIKKIELSDAYCQMNTIISNADMVKMPAAWWDSSRVCKGRYLHYDYQYVVFTVVKKPSVYLLTLRVIKANLSMINQVTFKILGANKKLLSWRQLK